ncbi:MAG: response regulator [Chloroflexi bacterium]|nr:response regulator [Chloroflexota bacterium]
MKFKILVVDDDPNLRVLLRQMLEFRGFDVVEAEDGWDALAKVEKAVPDVIVLDVMMPEIDGIEVCKQLRSRPETVNLPIIMLSGKVHRSAVEEGLQAGADKYLCKPIPLAELIKHVREVLPTHVTQVSSFSAT